MPGDIRNVNYLQNRLKHQVDEGKLVIVRHEWDENNFDRAKTNRNNNNDDDDDDDDGRRDGSTTVARRARREERQKEGAEKKERWCGGPAGKTALPARLKKKNQLFRMICEEYHRLIEEKS